jgi:hypothetical protein
MDIKSHSPKVEALPFRTVRTGVTVKMEKMDLMAILLLLVLPSILMVFITGLLGQKMEKQTG